MATLALSSARDIIINLPPNRWGPLAWIGSLCCQVGGGEWIGVVEWGRERKHGYSGQQGTSSSTDHPTGRFPT